MYSPPLMKSNSLTEAQFALRTMSTISTDRVTFSVGIGAATSNFPQVYVNEQTGDDVHGDGTREKPFRTRERAAQAIGVPLGMLTPRPRKPLPDPPPKIGYRNRHERRAAKARFR